MNLFSGYNTKYYLPKATKSRKHHFPAKSVPPVPSISRRFPLLFPRSFLALSGSLTSFFSFRVNNRSLFPTCLRSLLSIYLIMLKRKLDPSTDARDFSIRGCPKDLRLRRIISPGSDSKGIKFAENGGPDIGSCEASGGKDPIMDKDLIKGLDKVDRFCDSVQVFLFF